MKTRLVIDTSFFAVRIHLFTENAEGSWLQVGYSDKSGFGSAEALTELVHDVLLQSKSSLSDIGSLVVVSGPGSFTGLRVGVASGQAYSLALGIPLTGVSTLLCLACSEQFSSKERFEVSLRASKTECFAATFERQNREMLSGVGEVALMPLEDAPTETQFFENGLHSDAPDVDWQRVFECLSMNEGRNPHIQNVSGGLGLEILYGKGSSAIPLSERSPKK